MLEQLKEKLSGNLGSTLLGFVVVLILGGFLLNVFRGNQVPEKQGDVGEEGETVEEVNGVKVKEEYTVAKGDTLWSIASKTYDSGYNWVSIAEANNLDNPDAIEEGQELLLPDVAKILPETGIAVSGGNVAGEETEAPREIPSEYTVKKGDSLWKIAIALYDNGYKWVDIARANNLPNPDYIEVDTVLVIPK